MTDNDLSAIVDIDRYPLHRPDAPAVANLLTEGRAALDARALFAMPGLVRRAAAETMARELEGLVPGACRYETGRIAYIEDGTVWPDGHPRGAKLRCSYHQVLNYQIPNDSLLRRLYYWEPLREFLRQVMGYETFHRSECPHLALTSKVAGPGDTDGWHFDSNDVVFSILLQAPEGGGRFEYVPFIRTETEENYDAVKAVLDGADDGVRRPEMGVGDLTVFKGDESLHRVTTVEGNRRRVVGLFCYDRKPGTVFDRGYIDELQAAIA